MVQTTMVLRTPNAAQIYRSVYTKNRSSFEAAMQSHPTADQSLDGTNSAAPTAISPGEPKASTPGFRALHPHRPDHRKQPTANGENSQPADSVNYDRQLALSRRQIDIGFSRIKIVAAVIANDRLDDHRPNRPQIPRPRPTSHAVSAALGTTRSTTATRRRIARQHFMTETALARRVLNHLAAERALLHVGAFSDR